MREIGFYHKSCTCSCGHNRSQIVYWFLDLRVGFITNPVLVPGCEISCFLTNPVQVPGHNRSGFITKPILVPERKRSGFIMNPEPAPGRERSGFIMNPVHVLVQDISCGQQLSCSTATV